MELQTVTPMKLKTLYRSLSIAAAVDAVACREGMNRYEAVAYLLAKALENEDWQDTMIRLEICPVCKRTFNALSPAHDKDGDGICNDCDPVDDRKPDQIDKHRASRATVGPVRCPSSRTPGNIAGRTRIAVARPWAAWGPFSPSCRQPVPRGRLTAPERRAQEWLSHCTTAAPEI